MTDKRNIEVFSAGCPVCEDAVGLVQGVVGGSHEVHVRSTNEDAVLRRARALGIRSLPAVVIDGDLADCCAGGGVSERTLRAHLEGLAQEHAPEAPPRAKRGCC